MKRLKELYGKLPKEVTVFIEYILPSAVLAALVDYLAGLDLDNVYVMAAVNLVLIFLRQIKPRVERLRK